MAEAEVVLLAWLNADVDGVRFCTELPADLADVLPVVQVTRIGGTDDGQFSVYDNALMDFDCYAATRSAARTLAEQIRTSIRTGLPGQKVGTDAFVIRCRSLTGPSWTPYENTAVRRFTYTAEVRIHSI